MFNDNNSNNGYPNSLNNQNNNNLGYNQQGQNFDNNPNNQWQQQNNWNNNENWQNNGWGVNQNYNQQGQNNGYVPNPNYPQDNQGQNSGYQYPQQPTFTPYSDNTQPNNMLNFDNTQVNIPPSNDLSQYSKKKNKKNKKKKKGGCLWGIIKFFFWLFLIIAVIVGIVMGVNYFKNKKEIETLEASLGKLSFEEMFMGYEEKLKSEQSDIDGLTKYEKLEKGLSPEENSDTDGDGLTDKEEIEVYNTDPLRISTSGDGISDGLKVQNNLELTKKYKSNELSNIGVNSKFETVKLNSVKEENGLANVYKIDGYKVNGIETYNNYAIHSYNGKVELDFSKEIEELENYIIIKESGEADKDYEVLEDKNGVVTVNLRGESCVISIIKSENKTLDFFFSVNNDEEIDGNDAYLIVSPISLITGELHCYMWEKSLFAKDSSERGQVIGSYLSTALGNPVNMNHFYVNPVEFEVAVKVFDYVLGGSVYKNVMNEQGMEVSDEDVSMFEKALQIFIVGFRLNNGNWGEAFVNPEKVEEVKEKPSKYMSTFNVNTDALPFANLCTYISPGGNCAGFSWITARVFNSNSNKRSGSYTSKEVGLIKYDINNSDFDTFFDKYLNDYKSRTYWTDKYSNMPKMSYEDYEGTDGDFINFLGYHLRYANENTTPQSKLFNEEFKWSEFEKLQKYFASGDKVACLSMFSGNSGHSVLCYGLEQDEDNPNVWYMYVYDNNFPNHKFNGKYRANNKVKVVKYEPLIGEDYFEWTYYPLPNELPNYKYTSKAVGIEFDSMKSFAATAMQIHTMCVYDENLNEIF